VNIAPSDREAAITPTEVKFPPSCFCPDATVTNEYATIAKEIALEQILRFIVRLRVTDGGELGTGQKVAQWTEA